VRARPAPPGDASRHLNYGRPCKLELKS
jgi:hypothetical protein